MTFGVSPKYTEDISLENLTREEFLVIAIEAAKKLKWNIGHTNESGFVAYTNFSMSSWSEQFNVEITDETATLKSECNGNQVMDWGKNKRNIEKFVETFDELKTTFSPEEIQENILEFRANLVSREDDAVIQIPMSARENSGGFFGIFIPRKDYFITPILINLNIGIFILMVASGVNAFLPDTQSLLNWGANFKPMTLEGGWWRLFTSCFLHIGIIHLLMNMYALHYIGLLLEPHLGSKRFTAAYLLTGIAASTTSLWWHDLTVSAGASGAIFGMYGVFLAMLTTNLIEKSARKTLLTSIAIFIGYNLLNGLKGGVDNAAHIGGLISGLFIGYSFYPSLKKPDFPNLKNTTIGLVSAFIITGTVVVCLILPNDVGEYDRRIKEFVTLEEKALEVFKFPEGTSNGKLLFSISQNGIPNWNKSIKLLKELNELDLPGQYYDRNEILIRYCELRLKSYGLMYKGIKEDTDMYNDSLELYTQQLQGIIDGLQGKQK